MSIKMVVYIWDKTEFKSGYIIIIYFLIESVRIEPFVVCYRFIFENKKNFLT